MTMADTIAVMNRGSIEQLGAPALLYERPLTAFVASFLGKSNLLYGNVENGAVRLDDGTLIRADLAGATGRVAVGVRPEKVTLGESGENRLTGTVRESAYIGVATEFVVATAAGSITVFHQNAAAGPRVPAVGSQVTLNWPSSATFVVDSPKEDSPS